MFSARIKPYWILHFSHLPFVQTQKLRSVLLLANLNCKSKYAHRLCTYYINYVVC